MYTQSPIFISALRWVAAAAAVLAAGCANTPPSSSANANANVNAGTAAPDTTAASSGTPRPAPTGGSVAGQARTFSTQLATYTSVSFDAVPGWARDDFSESWPAFLGSCKVLTGRGAEWKDVCARALRVDSKNSTAIRAFFEQELSLIHI